MPRAEHFEQAYAVVRVDAFLLGDEPPDDWSTVVAVKEVWWSLDEAEAEVDRLNSLADDEGGETPYHWQHVRVRRRG